MTDFAALFARADLFSMLGLSSSLRAATWSVLVALPLAGCDCEGNALSDVSAVLEVAPESVDFGKVAIGGLRVRGVTLRNQGGLALGLASVTIEGGREIALASRAPAALPAGGEVTLNLAYEPVDVGVDEASLLVQLEGEAEPRRVPVRGEGVAAGARVVSDNPTCGDAPGSLSFGRVAPGQMAELGFSIVAEGTAPLTVLSAVRDPGSTAAFELDDPGLPATLAPGEALELRARFRPTAGGPAEGRFVITTDAEASPSLVVPACGEGVAPALCARPVPVDLGAAAPGDTTSASLTLESCGAEPVELRRLAFASGADPAFRLTQPSLPATLAPGETLDVELGFTPSDFGRRTADLEVGSSAPGSPLVVPVVARGAMPCGLELVPSRLVFTSGAAERSAVLVNTGASACEVTRLEVTSGATTFALAAPPTLPLSVPSGGTVDVPVRHSPSGAGVDEGALEVEEGGTTQQVRLVGNPDVEDGCHLTITPAAVSFGAVPPGEVRSRSLSLENIGDEPCFLRGVELGAGSHPDFVENAPSLGIIFPGRTKDLAVSYTPSSPGVATGSLEVETTDVTTGTFVVPLVGASAAASLCVRPTQLAFGPTATVRDRSLTLDACGGRSVTVRALDFTLPDPEFTIPTPPGLPLTLAAGQSEQVTVRYAPADMAGDTAVLTVRSDDPARPAIPIRMTGGPEIVPASAGRFLYYWQIPNPLGGDIMKLPLQGNTTTQPWWGPRTGKACAGCHNVSPDGRYVAIIEAASFRMVDTTTDIALAIPNGLASPSYLSWNPDVQTNPPYQYAYDAGGDIAVAGLFAGELRSLQGADDPAWTELMPTWGSNGQIAFARGMRPTQNQNGGNSFGFQGTVDILTVPEAGGTPTPLRGASGDGAAHYYPQYSPNGRFVAITHSRSAQSTIAATDARVRLVAADNSGTVLDLPNLNGTDGASSYPTWSVDGRFLSFSSNRAGGEGDWDIYVAPIDPMTGADQAARNVRDANSRGFEHAAQWSP